MPALADTFPDIYVPTFDMNVAERLLPPSIAKTITEVSVEEYANGPSSFSFKLNDPNLEFVGEENLNGAKGGDKVRLREDTPIEITLRYVGQRQIHDGNHEKSIVGVISAISVDFPSDGPVAVQIQGYDMLYAASRGTFDNKFREEKRDSDVVERIARKYWKQVVVDPTPERKLERVQQNQSDLAFISDLAQKNGYTFWVEGKRFHFGKERATNTFVLEWHKTLVSFSPRLSTAGQVQLIRYRGWDPQLKQPISAVAERPNTPGLFAPGRPLVPTSAGKPSERVIPCPAGATSAEEAQNLAKAEQAAQSRRLVTGSGISVGDPRISAGTILQLKGIGRFEGQYLVERTTHTLSEAGYQTSFDVSQRS